MAPAGYRLFSGNIRNPSEPPQLAAAVGLQLLNVSITQIKTAVFQQQKKCEVVDEAWAAVITSYSGKHIFACRRYLNPLQRGTFCSLS